MKVVNSHPTQFTGLNELLVDLTKCVDKILGDNLVGVYLVGSFALGDADKDSDCDFLIPVHSPITAEQETALRALHNEIPNRSGYWAINIEGSYPLVSDLGSLDTLGKAKWLFINRGHREMEWSTHCNSEAHRWTLTEKGITIAGPEPKTFSVKIPAEIMRNKMIHEAEVFLPELYTWTNFGVAWSQRYAVTTLCRILYTINTGEPTSKKKALLWGKDTLDKKWSDLIQKAMEERTLGWNPKDVPSAESVEQTLDFVEYAKKIAQSSE